MSANVSIRRAKIREQKAKQQAMIAMVVGIALLALFLFVLIPVLFDVAIRLARSNNSGGLLGQSDTLPPQRPVIEPLPEATNLTSLEVKGYTEANAKVNLFLDGNEQATGKANEEGSFSFPITLNEAEHQLWVVAEDEAGNVSPLSETFVVKVDTTTPSFTIDQPIEGAVFSLPRERAMTIKGKVSEEAKMFINSSQVTTSEDGAFETVIQLGEGKNEITLKAQDEAGNVSEEKKLTVEYRP